MAEWLKYLLTALIGYALGNISIGILVARAWGVNDIRECGSGNAGSTNVLRTLGWLPSILTLLGDCGKAYLASMIGKWIAGDIGLLVGGICCVIGHDFPLILRFRGGKGVASTVAGAGDAGDQSVGRGADPLYVDRIAGVLRHLPHLHRADRARQHALYAVHHHGGDRQRIIRVLPPAQYRAADSP